MDAALYWLARFIERGADPVFIARRLCILASEDVGLADPQAIVQAAAAAQITQLIGLPEGLYPLSQATIYLARAEVQRRETRLPGRRGGRRRDRPRAGPTPLHLRNAVTPLMTRVGYGEGYKYAHDDSEGASRMTCRPEGLEGRSYFEAIPEGPP